LTIPLHRRGTYMSYLSVLVGADLPVGPLGEYPYVVLIDSVVLFFEALTFSNRVRANKMLVKEITKIALPRGLEYCKEMAKLAEPLKSLKIDGFFL